MTLNTVPLKRGEPENMREMVEFIVRQLVDEPEMVTVNEIDGDQIAVLEVRVSKPDIGKVIGKKGRTAQALRTILHAASAGRRKRAMLEIIE